MAECDVQSLMDDAACFNTLTPFQLAVVQAELLKQILLAMDPGADTSPEALLESGKCFNGIEPGLLRVIQLQLLCEISQA